MNDIITNGGSVKQAPTKKRRIFLSTLMLSFFCFSGALFAPAAGEAAAAKTSTKTTVNKSSANAKPKKAVASKKKRRRTPYVRSLMPAEERAALRDRGISSGFGPRAVSARAVKHHKGIDIPAPKDSKILAFNDGEVSFTGRKNGYGIVVIIKQIDGREALYAHMNKSVVKIGDHVTRGDHIGHIGRTGRATGYHLHFEIIEDGQCLNPAHHVWHSAELVLGPGDLDPQNVKGQSKVAMPNADRIENRKTH